MPYRTLTRCDWDSVGLYTTSSVEGSNKLLSIWTSHDWYLFITPVYFSLGGTAVYGVDYTITGGALWTVGHDANGYYVYMSSYASYANKVELVFNITDNATYSSPQKTIIFTVLPDPAVGGTYEYSTSAGSSTPCLLNITENDVMPPTIGVVQALQQAASEPSTNRSFRIISVDPAAPWNQIAVAANTTVYYTLAGTATNGLDYTIPASPAVIPINQSYVDVLVTVVDDAIPEDTENVQMIITPNAGYLVSGLNPSVQILIYDNEVVEITQRAIITVGQTTIQETSDTHYNQTVLSVGINKIVTSNLTVNFTLEGTAVRGVDYNLFVNDGSGNYVTYTGALSYTFVPSGAIIQSGIGIQAINNSIYVGNRTVIVSITPSSLFAILPSSTPASVARPYDALLTIIEDEVSFIAPTLPTDPVDPGSPDYPVDGTSTIPIDRVVETENEFIEVSSITKTEPSQCDITVEDADGKLLARLANNELSSVYQIIDVSELPWSTASGSTLDHYVEILYKKALPTLVNDGDEFPAIGYDDIVVNKMMQIFAEEQGNGKSAMAYDMKASRSLARMAEEENRATVDCVGFVSNAHDGLLRRVGSLLRLR